MKGSYGGSAIFYVVKEGVKLELFFVGIFPREEKKVCGGGDDDDEEESVGCSR